MWTVEGGTLVEK